MCSSLSIDADRSILIIPHARLTPFVLLFSSYSVSLSCFSMTAPPLTPHPRNPLIIRSCSPAIAISVPLLYITRQTLHTLTNDLDAMCFCVHSFVLLSRISISYHLRYFHLRPFPCSLGSVSTPETADFRVRLRLLGRLAGVVHTTRGHRTPSLPWNSSFSSFSPY